MLMIVVLLIANNSLAIDIPVAVDATTNDTVGKRLVYKIKEGINRSSTMHVTYKEEVGLGLHIVTLEGDRNNPGNYAMYSVTWTWINPEQFLPFYLNSLVGACGTKRVDEVAESIVADTKEQSEDVLKIVQEMEELLKTMEKTY